MRIKSRRNLPVRFTFLIRIFLVFIVSSALLSIYGLNFARLNVALDTTIGQLITKGVACNPLPRYSAYFTNQYIYFYTQYLAMGLVLRRYH